MTFNAKQRAVIERWIGRAAPLQGVYFRSVEYRYMDPKDVLSGDGTRKYGGRFAPKGEEWLLLPAITAAALSFKNYFLWYGMLFAFTLHLIVLHLILGNLFHLYVHGVFTAALFLLPSAFMLFYSTRDLHYGWRTILLSALTGTIIAGVNLRLKLLAMPVFSRWLDRFSRER